MSAPCYAAVTEELARGWMSLAGAMGGHTVVAKLLRRLRHPRAAGPLPAADGDRRGPGDHGADRARRRLGPAGDAHDRRRDGDDYVVNGSKTWITNARRAGLVALLCKTDPDAPTRRTAASASCWSRRARASRCPATCPSSATRASRAASCPSTTSGCRRPTLLGDRGGTRLRPDDARTGDRPHPGRRAGRSASAGPRWRTRCATPRSGRPSASRSGSTSPSATTSPTWRPR